MLQNKRIGHGCNMLQSDGIIYHDTDDNLNKNFAIIEDDGLDT